MLTFAIWPLGTLRIVRSSVRMRVERRPIESTVPDASPTFRKSPTQTARSKISERPPMTFSSVFCAASATAMPPMPRPAIAAVGSPPRRRIMTSTRHENHQAVREPPRDAHHRRHLRAPGCVSPLPNVPLERRVHEQQQPRRRTDREQHRDRPPELALEQRQIALRDQPSDGDREDDEAHRAGEACRADTGRHEAAQPFPACEGDPDRVEYRHQAIRQRNDQEQREPIEQSDAGHPRLHQERRQMLIEREEIDLAEGTRNRFQRAGRKQPDRRTILRGAQARA